MLLKNNLCTVFQKELNDCVYISKANLGDITNQTPFSRDKY